MQPLDPTDPRLHQACAPLTARDLRTKLVQSEIDSLLNYVYGSNNKGESRDKTRPMTVGLSANQVGIPKQICVVDLAVGRKKFHDIHVLINPRIIRHSRAVETRSEGCVNLKEIWGEVERYRWVEVAALDRSGNRLTIRADGWAGRLLQHEIDHLNGRLFINHLTDPTKAHKVAAERLKDYNNRANRLIWPHHIDVSHLL